MTGVETWQLAAAARFVTTACCKKLRNPCLSILWHSGCKNHDVPCYCVTEVFVWCKPDFNHMRPVPQSCVTIYMDNKPWANAWVLGFRD
jgi:hypothetical protein